MAGLGCRFMTAYHALTDRATLRPGDAVAIHGCGGVGLSAVHIADALGAEPLRSTSRTATRPGAGPRRGGDYQRCRGGRRPR
ncbi:hypothetical protein C9J85_10060 [Haloferax sp. wsp5]|nr:hypothetical protein C9J85_10060 [Haloferax sp. wsp5]